MTTIAARRSFLKVATAAAITALAPHLNATTNSFHPIFDGKTLTGWTPKPRGAKSTSLGKWTVLDGVLIGAQHPVGAGCYLVSDEAFTNFELQLDARPDWPADTGIYLRAAADGHAGIQVNLDYRPHGSIAEINTAKIVSGGWSKENFITTCGHAGHIVLEVHNNAPGDWLGNDRWDPGAVCRWRNIKIKTL